MKLKSRRHKRTKHKRTKHKRTKHKRTKHKSPRHKSIKLVKRLRSKTMRKYKCRRGGNSVTSVPINPFASLQAANAPGSVHQQVLGASAEQNLQNRLLQGGKNRRSKKQRGGIGNVGVCGGSVVNSSDGYGYVSPSGCFGVPVVPNGQDLAIGSAHISAWGQANAEYDPLYQ